ncbi:glycosyltransferase family 2 protein [Pseudoroseomonas globiformis]|uniref:Glycosyltransferase family 2 protein n=1 Tax=Teichococcus globiformis TaxID=2307229 RepID=A0ABV7FY66_9PROT
MANVTLVATMRDEGPYLLEWVAYHRMIGFSEIVVCSNNCVDGTPALLDALQARGQLRHIPCDPGPDDKAQLFAYQQVEAVLSKAWPDVLMVLDGDEFLNIHVGGGTVPELLGSMPQATAMMINWRIFGSAGHESWSADSVLQRFRQAAARNHGVNRSFKTLFRNPGHYRCPLLPHGPGYARADALRCIRVVDGAGQPLPERYARSEEFLQTDPGAVTWRLAQVNHYNTRSRQDYLVKHWRGGGLGSERWDRASNWEAFNRNEETDLSIERHAAATRQAVTELLADPLIHKRHNQCLNLYGSHVEALAKDMR